MGEFKKPPDRARTFFCGGRWGKGSGFGLSDKARTFFWKCVGLPSRKEISIDFNGGSGEEPQEKKSRPILTVGLGSPQNWAWKPNSEEGWGCRREKEGLPWRSTTASRGRRIKADLTLDVGVPLIIGKIDCSAYVKAHLGGRAKSLQPISTCRCLLKQLLERGHECGAALDKGVGDTIHYQIRTLKASHSEDTRTCLLG